MPAASRKVKNSFVRGLYGASLGQLGRRLFGFAANLYLLTKLTPHAMGEFVILQFITLQIPYWVGTGLNMAMVRGGKSISVDVRRTVITLQFLAGTFAAYLMWRATGVIQAYYAASGDFVMRYLPWMLLAIPLLVVKQFLVSQWHMRLAFAKTTTADLVEHVGYLGVAIALCQFTPPVVALMLGFAAGRLASFAYLAYGFGAWGIFLPRFRFAELRPLARFGSFVQLGNLCNQMAEAVLPIVLGKVGGTDSVGLVSWAMRLVWIPQSITTYVDGIAFATFCRLQPNSRRYRWVQTTLAQALVAFTATFLLGLNLYLPQLTDHVFGEQWEGTRTMVLLFSAYVLSNSAASVIVQSTYATGGAKFLFKMSIVSVVSFWTVGAALIHYRGALGYGMFYFLLIAYSAAIYRYGVLNTGFRWKEALGRPLAASAIALGFALALRALPRFTEGGLFFLAAEGTLVLAASLALHYLFWGKTAARMARDNRRFLADSAKSASRVGLRKAG